MALNLQDTCFLTSICLALRKYLRCLLETLCYQYRIPAFWFFHHKDIHQVLGGHGSSSKTTRNPGLSVLWQFTNLRKITPTGEQLYSGNPTILCFAEPPSQQRKKKKNCIDSSSEYRLPRSRFKLQISKCLPSTGKMSDNSKLHQPVSSLPKNIDESTPLTSGTHGLVHLCIAIWQISPSSVQKWLKSVYLPSRHCTDTMVTDPQEVLSFVWWKDPLPVCTCTYQDSCDGCFYSGIGDASRWFSNQGL